MNRRNFLSQFGIGVASAAATTVVPAEAKEEKQQDASLRPKCPYCRVRMLVRGSAAYCPSVTCKRYGKRIAITIEE